MKYILDVLVSLLAPISELKTATKSSNIAIPKPDISNYVVLGFNAVNEALEEQAHRAFNMDGPAILSDDDIAYLFVCKFDMKSSLLWSHFPALVAATKNVRLIPLPAGASSYISDAAGAKRLSVLGLRKGYIISKDLEKRIEEKGLGVVEKPGWMNQIKLLPPVIATLQTTAPIKSNKNQKVETKVKKSSNKNTQSIDN